MSRTPSIAGRPAPGHGHLRARSTGLLVRLTRAADHSGLWLVLAAAGASFAGKRGRRAPAHGVLAPPVSRSQWPRAGSCRKPDRSCCRWPPESPTRGSTRRASPNRCPRWCRARHSRRSGRPVGSAKTPDGRKYAPGKICASVAFAGGARGEPPRGQQPQARPRPPRARVLWDPRGRGVGYQAATGYRGRCKPWAAHPGSS